MSALAFQWMYWIIGGAGLAGVVALAVLAPAAALLLWKLVSSFLRLLLGTRIGCALLAAGIAWVASDLNRHKIDDAAFAERIAAVETAKKERDAKIAVSTKTLVIKEIADDRATEQNSSVAVNSFRATLPVAGACPVGTDADRLRAIAVGASALPAKRQRHRRVQKSTGGSPTAKHRRDNRLPSPVGGSPGGAEPSQ